MAIKQISISNFKSFKDLEIELGKLSIIVGANASGKSNFIQVFKFVKDISDYGLDNAISLQGGVEYLRNIRICSSRNFFLRIVSDQEFRFVRKIKKRMIGIKTYELVYEFAIEFNKRGMGFRIVNDKLTQKLEFFELIETGRKEFKEKESLGLGEITLSNADGKIRYGLQVPEQVPLKEDDIFSPFLKERKLPTRTLILETHFFHLPTLAFLPSPFEELFTDISIYDFDPKLPKKGVPITGKTELEEDGSNLAIVLKDILRDKKKKRKFANLIKDLLPFVDDVDVAKFADKSLLFKLREIYARNLYLPASLISDGTISLTALIIALYFEKKPLIIIEEPERNIHPFLISKVVNMLKETSEKKQIIVTTHNPEILKHVDLENILLISRNKEGFSNISRPGEKKEIQRFLKNEIGIEELYVQNLLAI